MGLESGRWKVSLQLVFYCSTREDTEELGLGEQREKPVGSLPDFLAGCSSFLSKSVKMNSKNEKKDNLIPKTEKTDPWSSLDGYS